MYGAAILFEVSVGGDQRRHEIRIVLLSATGDESAWACARAYAENELHEYENAQHELVRWSPVDVLDVTESPSGQIDEAGTEIYSWPIFDASLIPVARQMLECGRGDRR